MSANSILKELFKKFWILILLFLDIFYCNTLFPSVNVLKHSFCSSSHFFLFFFFFFKFTLPMPLTVNIQCSLNGERRSSWACRLLVLMALTFFHPCYYVIATMSQLCCSVEVQRCVLYWQWMMCIEWHVFITNWK